MAKSKFLTKLVAGDRIEKGRIVRYIKPSHYEIIDDKIIVKPSGFLPRVNERGLSVNLPDGYIVSDPILALSYEPGVSYAKSGNGRLARLEVSRVKKIDLSSIANVIVEVVYDPTEATPSHSLIVNIPDINDEELDLFFENELILCVSHFYKALIPKG